jgi:prepilin-type N-terminal cleavage/methylation domain-containing protein
VFTLTEMLVVMVVGNSLLLIAAPAVHQGLRLARDTACRSHLKRLG